MYMFCELVYMLYHDCACVKMFVLCNVHFICTNTCSKCGYIKLYRKDYVITSIYYFSSLEPYKLHIVAWLVMLYLICLCL